MDVNLVPFSHSHYCSFFLSFFGHLHLYKSQQHLNINIKYQFLSTFQCQHALILWFYRFPWLYRQYIYNWPGGRKCLGGALISQGLAPPQNILDSHSQTGFWTGWIFVLFQCGMPKFLCSKSIPIFCWAPSAIEDGQIEKLIHWHFFPLYWDTNGSTN